MTRTAQTKEEFYIRQRFDDEIPVFVDATRWVRLSLPYELGAKKSLKGTCGVRTDNEVVAFSLRSYTGKQAEKEVENVETTENGRITSKNLFKPRMPRKTLHELNETARALAAILGTDVVAELNGDLYVLSLTRVAAQGELQLTGRLLKTDAGYERGPLDGDVEFELPVTGIRLRMFLRSPIRDRILAYCFSGYLTRKPGEVETVTRAAALALNSVLGLATFKMLSGLDHVDVPALAPGLRERQREPAERVTFDVPVMLFTEDGTPAARGLLAAEIDLDHVDPVTGGLKVRLQENRPLEWNPSVVATAGPAEERLRPYDRVLSETIAAVVHSVLGEDTARDIAYDIMLSDLGSDYVTRLRAATENFPAIAAKPSAAEVRSPVTGQPAA